MALSQGQKVDIRRHLNTPFAGIPQSGYTAGIRTILTVGQLEFYMNALQVEEECSLTGYPYGQINIFGTPAVGQTVTAVVNGTPVNYAVQAADVANKLPLQAVAQGLAQAINLANLGIVASAGSITSNDGTVPQAALPLYGQVTIVNQTTFTLTASANGLGIAVPANGATYPHPNTSSIQGAPLMYGYIAICNYLEERVLQADVFQSFTKADVTTFNKFEIEKRVQLYDRWRTKMGNLLSVGGDPAGRGGMGSAFGIQV